MRLKESAQQGTCAVGRIVRLAQDVLLHAAGVAPWGEQRVMEMETEIKKMI